MAAVCVQFLGRWTAIFASLPDCVVVTRLLHKSDNGGVAKNMECVSLDDSNNVIFVAEFLSHRSVFSILSIPSAGTQILVLFAHTMCRVHEPEEIFAANEEHCQVSGKKSRCLTKADKTDVNFLQIHFLLRHHIPIGFVLRKDLPETELRGDLSLLSDNCLLHHIRLRYRTISTHSIRRRLGVHKRCAVALLLNQSTNDPCGNRFIEERLQQQIQTGRLHYAAERVLCQRDTLLFCAEIFILRHLDDYVAHGLCRHRWDDHVHDVLFSSKLL